MLQSDRGIKMSFQINVKALIAANMFASTDKMRYYLAGVNVRWTREFVTFEATDGHRLVVLRHNMQGEVMDFQNIPSSFIIPSTLIARLKLDKYVDYATLDIVDDKVSLTYVGTTYVEGRIDGTFPDIKRVVPETVNGVTSQFNPEYVQSFLKAARIFNKKQGHVAISHNGDSPSLVNWLNDADVQALGVIMPLRINNTDLPCYDAAPTWFTGKVAEQEQEQVAA